MSFFQIRRVYLANFPLRIYILAENNNKKKTKSKFKIVFQNGL